MFITSLITPAVLLVLYTTFLAGVYRDAFTSSLPSNLTLDSKLLADWSAGSWSPRCWRSAVSRWRSAPIC